MRRPAHTSGVVEELHLGDAAARIVRHQCGDKRRYTVAFAPTIEDLDTALPFQDDELFCLLQAVELAQDRISEDRHRRARHDLLRSLGITEVAR